jgi:hypothetical protein
VTYGQYAILTLRCADILGKIFMRLSAVPKNTISFLKYSATVSSNGAFLIC